MICTAYLIVALFTQAPDATPSADELLKQYDAVMGPENFDGNFHMTAHRDDGTTRDYQMRVLKLGNEKMRIWFSEPASVRGQEMLRQGDNLWVYMPNLKRAVRLASRDSFQGGDFNNADVLRVNYQADYTALVLPSSDIPNTWVIELKAKSSDASYEKIKITIAKDNRMPVRGEYYAASGKMLRMAEFSDVKTMNGFVRPYRVMMKNMVATERYSVMTIDAFNVKVKPASTTFVLDNLGR